MPRRPNIVFFIADDHRHDALHVAGDPVVQTPTLDALAARGTICRRAHTMGGLNPAVCVPSRAALHTGCQIFRACPPTPERPWPGGHVLDPAIPTLGETFRRAGYHTHHIGKWHNDKASLNRSFTSGAEIFLGGMGDQWRIGVRDYDPTGEYPPSARRVGNRHATDIFCEAAMKFLREYQAAQPFFLYVAFTAPHDPRTARPEFHALYNPALIPLPANFMPAHPFDNGELAIRDELLAPLPRPPAIIRQHIADYYAMISHLDAGMGQVLETLRATGHADDTMVVYTSDHGLAVGQHGLLGKQNVYDHSVRIPMILAGPGIPAGKEHTTPAYLFDLYPTLCELSDVPVPAGLDGQSLDRPRDHVVSLYLDLHRMISNGRHKLIRYYRSATTGKGVDRIQLFDLQTDPHELHDRSGNPASAPIVNELTRRLAEWQRQAGDPLA
jgi:arylsulfatase A-like enzyme